MRGPFLPCDGRTSGQRKPRDILTCDVLCLMDVLPDGDVRFGIPDIRDNGKIVETIASGAHLTLFVTRRGSVVGSAVSPRGETASEALGHRDFILPRKSFNPIAPACLPRVA